MKLKNKNCEKCKNAQLYKSYYDNSIMLSCNQITNEKIKNLSLVEMMECIKTGKCYFYENGKPNENIIVSYND